MKGGLGSFELPSGWQWSQLRHVTSVLRRGTTPTYADDGPVRIIGQGANRACRVDWNNTRFHLCEDNPKRLKGYLEPGDVLVNSTGTGTLGRVAFFDSAPDARPCVADSHVTLVRSRRLELEPRFLFYFLLSQPFQDFMMSALVTGATNQIELSPDRMRASPVPLPPPEEQRRIADFLDATLARMERIESLRATQIVLLIEAERSALSALFTSDALYLNAGPTRLKYLLACRPRYGVLVPEFVDDGVPFIRVNALGSLTHQQVPLPQISREQSAQYSRTVVKPGDLLVSVVGTIGRAAVAPPHLEGANIARAVASLRCSKGVSSELLSYWARTAEFEHQVLLATGSDTAQPTLGMEDLAQFSLIWPEESKTQEVMLGIAREIVSERENVRSKLVWQRNLLEERKKALISSAVSGLLDVATSRDLA